MSKAGRPKKGSAGLPEWFDIEQYQQTEHYRAMEWHQQLAVRFVFHERLCGEKKDQKICDIWLHMVAAGPCLDNNEFHDAFVACGIVEPTPKFASIIEPPGDGLIRRLMSIDDPVHGVKVMNNQDMRHLTMEDAPDDETDRKTWHSEPFFDESTFANPLARYMEVDFRLPEELLKKQFAECLIEQKKNIKKTVAPFFKSQDFSVWYNSGVLPYIDLRLWELASGHAFRWSAFVAALDTIINQDVGSEEACRKTVKPLANKLMTENAIFILSHQAHQEAKSGRKKSGKLFVK
jgi:hypothetical protein